MIRTKAFLISLLICLTLLGCTGNGSTTLNSQEAEKTNLSEQVKQLEERPSDAFMMDLRETMNLSLKIFHAMENDDYTYLESVSASGVVINKDDNQVVYSAYEQEIRINFLKGLQFDNLEYWSSGYINSDKEFQLGFAQFYEDTHGTIYIDFIRENGQWLFNGFMTNA
ncbi:hypothetical protein [Paenibacillus crassostreae]|uniref:DUF4829 domain-containing protein n=1 Tax=Paenibacillus crassostreae TaxID=1763538 RepID=A0A167FFY6_9BACL|nr:hypothetical protein [Paenibacillus crassostreae]AOZ94444.1 hypothetical protein LPB68_21070 [Paenibacillus crassostreae]OAB76518.1 hypothetical protein PNBC_03670 [Paenibacillus crassostreae]